MRITEDGIALIKSFESCALTAYWDQHGSRWTIGWGRARGIKEGDVISQAEADRLLEEDMVAFELIISHLIDDAPITGNQFSALVSFCYNVGLGYPGVKDGFQVLKNGQPSTMLKLLHVGDLAGVAAEFPKWYKAGGIESAGILRRRLAEQALFLKEA